MESLINRFRNLSILLIVICAQLVLIAYQVRTGDDVPLLRVWAVTAVTPVERTLEFIRRNTWGFVEDYFVLIHTREQNEKLQKEIGSLKLENQYLRTELSTADRARALSQFQSHSPSKMIAARIIGNGTGANSKAVFVDRGSTNGVENGMAVVSPDGIVGKVVAAYPTASLVLLITDSNFAAGVISQKNRVHGTLKGQGHDGTVRVDYVQNEEKLEQGEWFYTSGDDRIFPKGFPVGQATTVRNGRTLKDVFVTPSGFQGGLEEVLIVLEAVHQAIPDVEIASPGYNMAPPPPASASNAAKTAPVSTTDADRLEDEYRATGEAQHHTFGEGVPGSIPPDFTKVGAQPAPVNAAAKPAAPAAPPAVTPAAPATTAVPSTSAAAPETAAPAKTNPTAPAASDATAKTKPPVTAIPPADATAKTKPTTPPPPGAPKPKPQAPLLVTDPTDADPTEPPVEPAPAKPKPKPTDQRP